MAGLNVGIFLGDGDLREQEVCLRGAGRESQRN